MHPGAERKMKTDPANGEMLERLFEKARTAKRSDVLWKSVRRLVADMNTEVFERTLRLVESPSSRERRLAADIFGQTLKPLFKREQVAVLLRMIKTEETPDVIASILIAIGHLGVASKAWKDIREFRNHKWAAVRHAFVFAILDYERKETVRMLMELTRDKNPEVRSWATFGLGSMYTADTPEIREMLMERASDSNLEVRGEAILGLALRGDPRAEALVATEIANRRAGTLVLEAADLVPSTLLSKVLVDWWIEIQQDSEEYDPCFLKVFEETLHARKHNQTL